jgi:hypothetical protein
MYFAQERLLKNTILVAKFWLETFIIYLKKYNMIVSPIESGNFQLKMQILVKIGMFDDINN